MRRIPPDLKKEIAADPFMRNCCLCGKSKGKVDWHHNLIYAGTQSNDPLSILPLCQECHRRANNSLVKETLDLIMFDRGLDPDNYPKSQLTQRRKYLLNKYGKRN